MQSPINALMQKYASLLRYNMAFNGQVMYDDVSYAEVQNAPSIFASVGFG